MATAASAAVPPCKRIRTPAIEASGCPAVTRPFVPDTAGRWAVRPSVTGSAESVGLSSPLAIGVGRLPREQATAAVITATTITTARLPATIPCLPPRPITPLRDRSARR